MVQQVGIALSFNQKTRIQFLAYNYHMQELDRSLIWILPVIYQEAPSWIAIITVFHPFQLSSLHDKATQQDLQWTQILYFIYLYTLNDLSEE